eukprot:7519412-Ditylum_brightwellii.AAC.1
MSNAEGGASPDVVPSATQGGTPTQRRRLQIRRVQFEGSCDELKGQVFDAADMRQGERFTTVLEEIARYIGANYAY